MDTREEILKILRERGAILQKDLWKEFTNSEKARKRGVDKED